MCEITDQTCYKEIFDSRTDCASFERSISSSRCKIAFQECRFDWFRWVWGTQVHNVSSWQVLGKGLENWIIEGSGWQWKKRDDQFILHCHWRGWCNSNIQCHCSIQEKETWFVAITSKSNWPQNHEEDASKEDSNQGRVTHHHKQEGKGFEGQWGKQSDNCWLGEGSSGCGGLSNQERHSLVQSSNTWGSRQKGKEKEALAPSDFAQWSF